MKKTALFIGWNRSVAGRESAALEHFAYAMNYLGKQKAAGSIDSFEPVVLQSHGGDLNGFVLIQGNRDKVEAMMQTEEWRDIEVKSNMLLQGHGIIRGFVGEDLQAEMARFGRLSQQIK